MTRRSTLALALIVLAPATSACDLAGEPPAPGWIWVMDTSGAVVHEFPIYDRLLGATCELGNFIGLSGDLVAWHEGGQIVLVDLAAGIKTYQRTPVGSILGLTDAGLLVRTSTWDGRISNSTFSIYGFGGAVTTLDMPAAFTSLVWHDSRHGVFTHGRDAQAVAVRDLTTGHAVLGPWPVDANRTVVAGGATWYVTESWPEFTFRHPSGAEVARLDARSISRFPGPIGMDASGVWTTTHNETDRAFVATRLDWSGSVVAHFPVPGDLVAASGPWVVAAAYSAKPEHDAPGLAPIPIMVLIALFVFVRRP